MGLFDLFRRQSVRAIRDVVALGAFIDEQALPFAEVTVHGYARLLAREQADALFKDAPFDAALRKACWELYPHALTMIGSMIEATLRPHAGARARAVLSGLIAVVLEPFDRRAVPPSIREAEWRTARTELMRSFDGLADQPSKSLEAIVQDHASFCLAVMPLHPKLAGDDFPALRNLLQQRLTQIEAAFLQRADMPALVAQLATHTPLVAPPLTGNSE